VWSPEMIRVLLIDDCDEVRETMRMLSERAGFETLEARDGLAGLQRAVEDEPDLVLVKAELPGLDGFDLQARLRADAQTAHIPVLVCSDSEALRAGVRPPAVHAGALRSLVLSLSARRMDLRIDGLEEGAAIWQARAPSLESHRLSEPIPTSS